MRCPSTVITDNCGNMHARAWRVAFNASGVPTSVTPIDITGPEGGSNDALPLDESMVEDLKVVVSGSGSAATTTVLGCGRAGMWCKVANISSTLVSLIPFSQSRAAVFTIAAGGSTGWTRMIDQNAPNAEHCETGNIPSPPGTPGIPDVQVSLAHGWLRGATDGQNWPISVVGESKRVSNVCNHSEGDISPWCKAPISAMRWDWSGLPPTLPTAWLPAWRFAPPEGGYFDQVPHYQNFSPIDAARSIVQTGAQSQTSVPIISSVGWLVDGCRDASSVEHDGCPCDRQAALIEYRDEVGSGACWTIAGSPTFEVQQANTNSSCMRTLNLHEALWNSGSLDAGGSSVPLLYSQASAIAAPAAWASSFQRLVVGARFSQTGSSPSPFNIRGVLWRGSSDPSALAGTAVLPDSAWCGRDLAELVESVRWTPPGDQVPVVRSWGALHQDANVSGEAFDPTISSGQSIDGFGRLTCFAHLDRDQPYVIARLVCVADLNDDGTVGGADLGMLLGGWGAAGPSDLDGNGTVNGADLGILLGAWGPVNIKLGCDNAATGADDITLIRHAAFQLGFDSLDDLALGLASLSSTQATYLATIVRMTADVLAEQGITP